MSDLKQKLWVVQTYNDNGYKPPVYIVAGSLSEAMAMFRHTYPARSPRSIQDLDVDLVTG